MSDLEIGQKLWNSLASIDKQAKTIKETATYLVMDAIIAQADMKAVYSTVMLGANSQAVLRNQHLAQRKGNAASQIMGGAVTSVIGTGLAGAIGLLDISLVTEAAAAYAIGKASPYLQDIWEKTLVEPNIEGVPISATTITSSREVEVGEQMMIVQSSVQKQYWTDNAVPKLKEWTLEGYLTPSMSLDALYLIKPSLKMQANFLDICASSRRPVLFKDNRGEFMFVQITNLQTTEEASYNNSIKVNVTLKEYKPFEVSSVTSNLIIANKMEDVV